MVELEDSIYEQIQQLSEEGNVLADQKKYSEAVFKFRKALELVPAPKSDWDASLWLYASIGDMLYMEEKFSEASGALFDAINCPGGIENGFVYLRLGECMYRLNDRVRAREFLLRAYMLEGRDIFSSEDPVYFDVLKDLV